MENENVYPRIILGLDISTACIGACLVKDDGKSDVPEILILTHKSPKVPRKIKGIEALFIRKNIFEEEFIKTLTGYGITDVVIEEPLLSSNNVNTVATLLRYNGMIAEAVYRILGIVPNFISSYDARTYSFPELVTLRKYKKNGEEYPLSHIVKAVKEDHLVLFGAYPFDIDKKNVMMNMVNETYPDIPWVLDKDGELKKENYDACDSLICALAYVNINHHGIETPKIKGIALNYDQANKKVSLSYTTGIWDKTYEKKIIFDNEIEERDFSKALAEFRKVQEKQKTEE